MISFCHLSALLMAIVSLSAFGSQDPDFNFGVFLTSQHGCPRRWGDVPQGLKPSSTPTIAARLKPCPDTKHERGDLELGSNAHPKALINPAIYGTAEQAAEKVGLGMNAYPRGFRVCVRTGTTKLVPKGRLSLAQDVSPGFDSKGRPSPAGTAENGPRRNPPSVVPAGLNHVS